MFIFLLFSFAFAFGQSERVEEGSPRGLFELLSEQQDGVVYLKDPCRAEGFSLVFSFSEDLQDPPSEEIAMVQFSDEFKDFLLAYHVAQSEVALYYSLPKKIGNRQIRVDYIAKIVSEDGKLLDFTLPEQIEIEIIDQDLMRILDIYSRQCAPLDLSQRTLTLINKNTDYTCHE